jgi:hypothetical protein
MNELNLITLLDASALLALLNGEAGMDIVKQHLARGCISSVNFAEVKSKLSDHGLSADDITIATQLGISIIPFTEEMANISAALRVITKRAGLSLGDRCCLATAYILKCPVLTADRAWKTLKLKNFDISIMGIR